MAFELGIGLGLNRIARCAGGTATFTPNYPSGLSYTTGLLGWYDSSQPSSLVKDGSNNISQWNNLFNGATQEATVLPAFTIPAGNSAPTFVTGQSYVYGTATGSKNGVLFDGTTSILNITGLNALLALKNYAVFIVTKPTATYTGACISLDDQQTANGTDLGLQIGVDVNNKSLSLNGTNLTNTNSNDGLQGVSFGFQTVGTTATNNQAWLYQYVDDVNFRRYTGSANVSADTPWDQLYIGGDINAGTFQNCLIGEILVYNMTQAQQGGFNNIKTIMGYLNNKWA